MVTELREAAPTAPDRLRERVRALREPQAGRAWRLRPALVAAVAIVVAVGVSAATIGGLTGSTAQEQKGQAFELSGSSDSLTILPSKAPRPSGAYGASSGDYTPEFRADPGAVTKNGRLFSADRAAKLAALPPGQRLQRFDVSMGLRVRDLSRATQTAVRSLSAAEREVVVLRVVLELDGEMTARVLGIRPTAVSTRLSRALQKLEERMVSDVRG